jgi:hypothetical protein
MNKRPAFAAVLLALSSAASAQTADIAACKERFFPNVSNTDIARAAEAPLPKMADALKEDERPYTLKAGPAFFDDGGKGVKIDFFRRMTLAEDSDAGSVAVSAGLGWTSRRDREAGLASESTSVQTVDNMPGNGHHSHGNGHGYGHDHHGDVITTTERVFQEKKVKSELFELLRLDYTTPEICDGLKMYAGVGAGVGRVTEKTKTVTDTTVAVDARRGCRLDTEESSQDSASDKSRKWKPFYTAFMGCKIDGKKTLGVPCDFTVECEKIFAGELKSKGTALTLGFGWDF